MTDKAALTPHYRRPIAGFIDRGNTQSWVVVCDDGAVFRRHWAHDCPWGEDTPIPGSERDAGVCKNGDEPR